jgi:S-adenosylmethionine:tRNA ribosyltransferase-isomerase
MHMSELDYELPKERIAAHPAERRDQSRLLVWHRREQRAEHRLFSDLVEYFLPTDLLVVNDTRVIPAKLELRKESGGVIPGLFVREVSCGVWEAMLRTRGRARQGDELRGGEYRFRLVRRLQGAGGGGAGKGMWEVAVTPAEEAGVVLGKIGQVPLPPYIEKMRSAEERSGAEAGGGGGGDRVRYQTVYAREGNSVAAPTAGLHFTPELLAKIEAMGVRRAAVNLEVGLGTFLPVETETLEAHPMHAERFWIPAKTVALLRQQRTEGGRIVVVGTTAVRALEAGAEEILNAEVGTRNAEVAGVTTLKISPGYRFQLTDALVTNFHLPRSTLMALVGAMIGLDRLKALYALAIAEGYRFYSYGDAMLILQ